MFQNCADNNNNKLLTGMRTRLKSSVLLLIISLVVALPFTIIAQQAQRQTLRGHVPVVVKSLPPLGRFPGTNRLNLAIGLPLRNQEALTNLLREIYDPASPNYRHYLTPEEFTKQFGPTKQDYQAVIAFAKANSLTVTMTHPNRMLVDVNGSVADIEKAFQVRMQVYQHPTENRTFYAPDVEPSLNLTVSILHISGLDNYSPPQPMLHKMTLQVQNASPAAGSGSFGSYIGKDFRAAYVPGVSLTGTGQSVGLLEFDGFYQSDITAYETQAGLPNVPVQAVLLDGLNGGSGASSDEVSLDIEMVISMAPGVSNVFVFEGDSADDMLNAMAASNQVKQLSSSWFFYPVDATADQIFLQFAAQGQSFFNASGDDDAYIGSNLYPLQVCDDPYITTVGGTTLTTSGSGGAWVSETVWNWGGVYGSGGGISTQYSIPDWQANVSMSLNQGSTTMRNVPDVALTADNVWVIYGNGSSGDFGGTSCAAPLWAGFIALANQQAAANGQPPVGFINPAIYRIGTGSSYTSCFHDITTGNNTSPSSPTQFYAVSGYDLCTGWGTPAGQNLIDALANPEALAITPASGFGSIGGVGGPFTITSQSLSLTNAGTVPLDWSVGNTAPWLNAAPTSGTLTPGGPSAMVTVNLNTAASNLVVGAYSATVWFTNLNNNIGQSRLFTLSVIAPPTITLQPTNQAVLAAATATFTVGVTGGLPLSYQWQDNGTSLTDGGNISGSTTTNLIISNVTATDIGTYSVIVTNPAGVTVSSNALLTMIPAPPVITTQPSGQTVVLGNTVNFSVGAEGWPLPLSYQWYLDGSPLTDDGVSVWGSATPNLSLLTEYLYLDGDLSCDDSIQVDVYNDVGDVWSSEVPLTVLYPPVIDMPPVCTAALVGGNVSFSVVAEVNCGEPLYYQWYFNGQIVGRSATLTLTNVQPAQAGDYDVQVYNEPGEDWADATLTVGRSLVVAWGDDSYNQTNLPCGLANVTAVAAGYGHSLALETNGTVVAWGLNNVGQCNVPSSLTTVAAIAAGYYHSLALETNGTVVAWGYSAGGICNVPSGLTNVVAIAAGYYHSLALTTNGTVAAWGWTGYGQCTVPSGLTNVMAIAAGGYHSLALKADGTMAAWGDNTYGQTNIPSGLTNVVAIAAGSNHNLALKADGTVAAWGDNTYGQTNVPSGLTNVVAIAAGYYHNLALKADGTMVAWGWNNAGQCNVPAGLTNVVAIAGGYKHSLAVINNGTPVIVQQPFNQTVTAGAPAAFSVQALGKAPLNYQWRFNGTNVIGVTNAALVLTNVQYAQAGSYAVLVTNALGSVLSSSAVLTVIPPTPVTIVSQPADQLAAVGDDVVFSVTASGTPPLSYQWQFNGTNISGATSSSLNLPDVQLAQSGNYAVQVSNRTNSVVSSAAVLTVEQPPVITTQPSDQTALVGKVGYAANFSVGAEGSPLSYQWYFDGGELTDDGVSVWGSATPNLTLQPDDTWDCNGSVSVEVYNDVGDVTSSNAVLTVLFSPVIEHAPGLRHGAGGRQRQFQCGGRGQLR